MSLRPTHRCYDDALELIVQLIKENPELRETNEVLLVHGIVTDSETKKPVAHAWVERGGMCYTAALKDNDQRVYVELPRGLFMLIFGVTSANAYSIRRAFEENEKSGHYGPWTDEHRALVVPRGTLRKEEEGRCGLCGWEMPPGEEMFRYHGYSGPCPTKSEAKP